MQLQPDLLITLTKEWNLLSRPVMQSTTWHPTSVGAGDDIVAVDEEARRQKQAQDQRN